MPAAAATPRTTVLREVAGSGLSAACANVGARCDAKAAREEARQVALVGKATGCGDIGQGRTRTHQMARKLQSALQQVGVWRSTLAIVIRAKYAVSPLDSVS